MSLRFLLDANVLSEPTKLRPNRLVLERLERHRGEIATGSVVIHELLFGVGLLRPSKKRDQIERYFAEAVGPTFPVLPYDREAASWHAQERARLFRLGQVPPLLDAQIAAITVTHGLVLVTRNVRDFRAFHELKVENWFDGPKT